MVVAVARALDKNPFDGLLQQVEPVEQFFPHVGSSAGESMPIRTPPLLTLTIVIEI